VFLEGGDDELLGIVRSDMARGTREAEVELDQEATDGGNLQ
jgi:hypothetical protein